MEPAETRRQSLARLICWAASSAILAVEPKSLVAGSFRGDESFDELTQLTQIIPGERVGDLWLGMQERDVCGLLGSPNQRTAHAGHSLAEMRQVLEVVNRELGTDMKAEDYPQAPSLYLSYHSRGVSVCLEGNRVKSIFVYTGVLSGYETGVFRNFFEGAGHDSFYPLRTLADVRLKLGPPSDTFEMVHAPIPSQSLLYQGIAFEAETQSQRISYITVRERK